MADDVPSRFQVDFSGLVLNGVYRVDRKLAEGGMGSVYLAEDTNLGRPVVVKVPHPRFLGEPGFRDRFAREVNELIRLEHPHIARILARGEHEEIPFFVLQYLGGGSLEDRFARGEATGREIVPWLRTVAETLDFVHARGLVHRDVKPANILFDEGGNVFLSDFGVAKVLEAEGEITETGVGVGSPKYMAPEQSHGKDVGPAADQYALAATAYEALAGSAPFEEGTALEILVKKTQVDPVSLADSAPDLPPETDAAVLRALSRDPAKRFPSCAEFVEAFVAPFATPTALRLAVPARRKPWLLVAVLGTILLVTGLWAVKKMALRDPPSGPSARPEGEVDRVVLLDPGAEPRQRLRYRVAKGAHERMRFTSSASVVVQMGEETIETPGDAPMVVETDVLVDEVDENEIRYRWVITSMELSPPPGMEVPARKIERLIGLTARGVASPRGISLGLEVEKDGRPLDPEAEVFLNSLYEELRHLVTPFPEEPVGPGARWEVTEPVETAGMRMTMTTVHELRSLEGYGAEIHADVVLTAVAQSFQPSGFPQSMRIISLLSRGESDLRLDLTQLVPRSNTSRVKLDLTGEMDVEVEVDGEVEIEKRELIYATTLATTVERR